MAKYKIYNFFATEPANSFALDSRNTKVEFNDRTGIVRAVDPETGAKAYISIHNPALVRFSVTEHDEDEDEEGVAEENSYGKGGFGSG